MMSRQENLPFVSNNLCYFAGVQRTVMAQVAQCTPSVVAHVGKPLQYYKYI